MGEASEVFTVPARRGRAARLNEGQAIKIVNTHGQQVVDFWAFNAADLGEFLSMEHLRATIEGIFPHAGDDLVTNQRRAILHFAEDTTPGVHDTLMAACDVYRYQLLGCEGYHDNCTDNLCAARPRRAGTVKTSPASPMISLPHLRARVIRPPLCAASAADLSAASIDPSVAARVGPPGGGYR